MCVCMCQWQKCLTIRVARMGCYLVPPALIVVKSLKGGYNYLHVLKYAHVVDLSDLK